MRRLTIDFETASGCDLKEAGAWVYAEHPTTEILCISACLDGLVNWTWIPGSDYSHINVLITLALDPSVIFEAHNAAFEQAIWQCILVEKCGFPPIPPERWDCTMARCYYRGLPGALDLAAAELGLDEQKDVEGRGITLALSKPMTHRGWMSACPEGMVPNVWRRKYVKGTFDRRPETLKRVGKYCLQDVKTEIELSKAVGPLSDYERRVWVLDQKMNQRGLRVDLDYVRAAKAVVAEASGPLLAEFQNLTGLEPTQVKELTKWCRANGAPQVTSLSKDALKALGVRGLEVDEDGEEEEYRREDSGAAPALPEPVRRALSIRSVLGSASIAKLDRMLACVCGDGRIRYTIQYHGAGTGRWAGRLFQPQNFPRGKIEGGHDPEMLVQAILAKQTEYIGYVYGDPIAAVASGLRHAIVAGDNGVFNTGDFAGIEARIVLALAGQHDKCDLLARIGSGAYLDMAETLFSIPKGQWTANEAAIENAKKQHVAEYVAGKGGVLGCGFQCGAANFNIKFLGGKDLPLAERVVKHYRTDWAPQVPKLWGALEDAALEAVVTKGRAEAYGIVYEWHRGWLASHLPDGQTMWYRNPEYCMRAMPWDATDFRPGWSYYAMKNGHWKKVYAYGGLLCLGGDTEVLTQRGFVRMVDICLGDRLWDGVQWVQHGGVVAQGVKKTISFGGIDMTPDHEVLSDGWKPAASSSYDRAASTCEALGREAGWDVGRQPLPRIEPCAGEFVGSGMRLRQREDRYPQGFYPGGREFVRLQHGSTEISTRDEAPHAQHDDASGVLGVAFDAGSLSIANAPSMAELRRPGHYSVRQVGRIREFLGGYGADVSERPYAGAREQQRQLRAAELPVGDADGAGEEPPATKRMVYDIVNAGPNRCFTVRGGDGRCVIAHNCENVVQKIARGFLCEAMFRLEDNGFPLVLTVHDECVSEVMEAAGDVKAYEQIMAEPTAFARAIKVPIAVEAWEGPRYKK